MGPKKEVSLGETWSQRGWGGEMKRGREKEEREQDQTCAHGAHSCGESTPIPPGPSALPR